jgi:hypothetical protein
MVLNLSQYFVIELRQIGYCLTSSFTVCCVLYVTTSCSTGIVLDSLVQKDNYSLMLFCRKLMDLGSLLRWKTGYAPI